MKRRSFLRRCAAIGAALGVPRRSVAAQSAVPSTPTATTRAPSAPTAKSLPRPGEVAAISGPGTNSPGTLASVMYRTPAGPGSGSGADYFAIWTSGCYAKDDGALGSLVFCSGGDGDYWGNEVYKFSLDDRRWSRESARSTGLSGERDDPAFDLVWGEHHSPGGVPPAQPGVPHNYDQVEYLPPSLGGGPRGALLFCTRTVVYRVRAFRHPHVFDLDARSWRRGSASPGIVAYGSRNDAPSWCLDPSRNRYWGIKGGEGGQHVDQLHHLDFDPATGLATSGNVRIGRFVTPRHLPFSRYWPTGDLMLLGGWNRTGNALGLWACPLRSTTSGFTELALTGSTIPLGRYGFAYCDDLDCFFVRTSAGHRQTIWRIEPPTADHLNRPWAVTEITMRGVAVAEKGNRQGMWKRFAYVPPLKCLVWVDDANGPVYAYRPAGA